MTAQRVTNKLRLLLLVAGAVAVSWLVLASSGSANAAQPGTDEPAQPTTPSLLAAVTDGLTTPLAAVDSVVGDLTQPVSPAGSPSSPAEPPAAPAAPAAAAVAPAAGLLSAVLQASHAGAQATPLTTATQALTTSLGTTLTTTVSTTTAALSTTVDAVTTQVGETITAATAAVPSATPVVGELRQTLAALAGATDQLKTPTDTAVRSLVAPAPQPSRVGQPAATAPAVSADTQGHASSAGSAPGGPGAPLALGLLLPLESAGPGAGLVQASSAHAAAQHVAHAGAPAATTAARAIDVHGLLVPGEGAPPSAPAPSHAPSTPAPAGTGGAGQVHLVLSTGCLAAGGSTRDAIASTSARLPLPPAYEPGESPD